MGLYQTKNDDGDATVDLWRLARRAKSPGVATTALYRGQEDSTTGKTAGKNTMASSCPQVLTIPRCPVP